MCKEITLYESGYRMYDAFKALCQRWKDAGAIEEGDGDVVIMMRGDAIKRLLNEDASSSFTDEEVYIYASSSYDGRFDFSICTNSESVQQLWEDGAFKDEFSEVGFEDDIVSECIKDIESDSKASALDTKEKCKALYEKVKGFIASHTSFESIEKDIEEDYQLFDIVLSNGVILRVDTYLDMSPEYACVGVYAKDTEPCGHVLEGFEKIARVYPDGVWYEDGEEVSWLEKSLSVEGLEHYSTLYGGDADCFWDIVNDVFSEGIYWDCVKKALSMVEKYAEDEEEDNEEEDDEEAC